MKKKKLLVFFLAAAMVCQSTVVSFAGEVNESGGAGTAVQTEETGEEIECRTYLEEERTYQGINDRYTVPDADVDFVKDLGSMTITVSFKTSGSGLMALAAVNSGSHTNSYISLYVNNGNTLGVELRDAGKNLNENYTQNVGTFNDSEWHTATFVIEEGVGCRMYFDQEKVKEITDADTYCTGNMSWEPVSVTFGGADRISGNNYPYTGSIRNARIYNGAASEEQIIRDHGGVLLTDPVITYGRNVFDGTDGAIVAEDSDAAAIAGFEQATFSFAYKLDSLESKLNALLSLSEKDAQNGYGAIYINPANGRLGFEVRDGAGHQYVTIPDNAADNMNWHTVAVTFSGTEAVFYFDGRLIGRTETSGVLTGTSWTADSVSLGGIQRNSASKWPFSGTINSVSIYDYALSPEEVSQLSQDTRPEDLPDYEEGVVKTEEYGILDMGDYGAFNYRIPSLVTTSDGVVIAGADQRHDHWSDWGNIDTVIRTSTDKGQTWSDLTTVIDLKSQPYDTGTQSAFLIDPSMIATEEGRVWMLVDMFPESTGFGSISQAGNGFAEAEDGNSYLALTDADGAQYTLRGTEVYDAEGNKTEYTVDEGSAENAFHNAGDLYDNGEYAGNIYLSSQNTGNDSAPLQVLKTCYLWLTYSDDNGETWSNPVNISGQVKEDWMKFCGTGPGFGIEIQNGEHAGRLVFPIYYTNSSGFQSSACIYSDDGGATWKRGMSPNDARGGSYGDSRNPNFSQQLTESQIIELNSGNLLQFMRNTGGNGLVAVSRSTDGGATWTAPVNTQATEVYCQLSVLHFGTAEDSKDRIILSNPGGSGRNNGTLRIGVVTENEDSFSIDWTDSKLFSPGSYAYSCLSDMGDGMIGLLYEKSNTIKFTSFNLAYITSQVNLISPTILSVAYTVEKETDHLFTLPGDKYVFTVTTDQNVIAEGAPTFRFLLNGEARYAQYVSGGSNDKTLVFEYTVQEGDEGQIAFRGPKIISDADSSVRNEAGLSVSAADTEVDFGYIGTDPSYDGNDLPLDNAAVTAGSSQSGQGPENAIDGNESTLWHTQWSAGHNREDHWLVIDYGKEYMVDGFRYEPRTSQTNGIITEYKIEVSTDGVNYTEAAEGTWAGDNSWKLVQFDPVKARYVKLTVLDALSSESANDYASATEVRATGTAVPEETADRTELENVIALADEYAAEIDSYTEDTVQAFWSAYNTAKAAAADPEADQEEVDSAASALRSAIDGLKLKEEISTAVLEYALMLAEDVDTEGVVGSVAEIFNERKAEAQDILERAKAGDPSVTQSAVDQSWQDLISIMQYMSFRQGDMTDLKKVVDLAESLDMTEYLEKGQQEFSDALAAAKEVLAEEFAEQSEIDQAWKDLLKAMSDLRLKPSKGALEELIASARSLSTEGAEEEAAAIFRSALARAVSVYEDEQATKEEVAASEEELRTAIHQLLASAGGTEDSVQRTDSSSGADLTAGVQQSSGSGSKAVRTGDSMMPAAGSAAVMMLAAAAAVLAGRKRR